MRKIACVGDVRAFNGAPKTRRFDRGRLAGALGTVVATSLMQMPREVLRQR